MSLVESYHYDPSKEVIHLPGKLFGPVGVENIRLVFDTGAYRTIVSTKLMDYVGYQATSQSKKVTTTSVVGKEYGYTVIVQRLSVLAFEFTDVEVACFDLPPKYDIDGLLGLDLLEKIEVTLRHKEKWIQLREI